MKTTVRATVTLRQQPPSPSFKSEKKKREKVRNGIRAVNSKITLRQLDGSNDHRRILKKGKKRNGFRPKPIRSADPGNILLLVDVSFVVLWSTKLLVPNMAALRASKGGVRSPNSAPSPHRLENAPCCSNRGSLSRLPWLPPRRFTRRTQRLGRRRRAPAATGATRLPFISPRAAFRCGVVLPLFCWNAGSPRKKRKQHNYQPLGFTARTARPRRPRPSRAACRRARRAPSPDPRRRGPRPASGPRGPRRRGPRRRRPRVFAAPVRF